MKKLDLNFLVVLGLASGLLAFTSFREGGIRGTIAPAEGAAEVLAIAGRDTIKTRAAGGQFTLTNVKKGTYTIWVKANSPYRDTTVQQVAVVDSAVTDVGKITLQR